MCRGGQGPLSTGSSVHISIWSLVLSMSVSRAGNHPAAPRPYRATRNPTHVTWVAFSLESPSWAPAGKRAQKLYAPDLPKPIPGAIEAQGSLAASLPSLLLFHFEGWSLFPSNTCCLFFLYTLPTPRLCNPKCWGFSLLSETLPKNSVQKGVTLPKGEEEIGEEEATTPAGEKHHLGFQTADPTLPAKYYQGWEGYSLVATTPHPCKAPTQETTRGHPPGRREPCAPAGAGEPGPAQAAGPL